MNKLTIIPYLPDHAMNIELVDYMCNLKNIESYPDHAKVISCMGPAFTAIRRSDNKIICCAGILIDRNGEGESWALFSPHISQHTRELYYMMKKIFNYVTNDLGLRRVNQYYNITYPITSTFAGRFGFKDMGMVTKDYKHYVWERK